MIKNIFKNTYNEIRSNDTLEIDEYGNSSKSTALATETFDINPKM